MITQTDLFLLSSYLAVCLTIIAIIATRKLCNDNNRVKCPEEWTPAVLIVLVSVPNLAGAENEFVTHKSTKEPSANCACAILLILMGLG